VGRLEEGRIPLADIGGAFDLEPECQLLESDFKIGYDCKGSIV
jgi:hypothetical protein